MTWDPFQRRVLAELGHAVYVVRDAPAAAEPPPAEPARTGPDTADPMLARLARAAGLAPARLLELAPDVAVRAADADAEAKRALWPRLRAMRRDVR